MSAVVRRLPPAVESQPDLVSVPASGPGADLRTLGVPTQPRVRSNATAKAAGYVALTKPRIIELLLVTTVPVMFVADRGVPSLWSIVATVLGGFFAAGGANAFNMVVDRDIDALMDRTKNRPLVTGVLSPSEALAFALIIETAAFAWLWGTVNLLSAALALLACLFYVFVYTLWLKRTTSHNIVIGGAAGSLPPMIGWAAVRNEIAWAPIVAFAIVFFWTPPHFWALAVKYRDDYSAASVPMLPSVASMRRTTSQMIAYTVAVFVSSLLFHVVAGTGWVYLTTAIVGGAVFLAYTVALHLRPSPKLAMRVFSWSITYLTLLFASMAIDAIR